MVSQWVIELSENQIELRLVRLEFIVAEIGIILEVIVLIEVVL